LVVAIVGFAAESMRRWAKSVRTEIREGTDNVVSQLDALAVRVGDVADRQGEHGERLSHVEGTLGLSGPAVWYDERPSHRTPQRGARPPARDE
ncbi:MAG: hypothetical protein ACRDUW_05085, partial [Pseudonocardiaceae bacterium]